MQAHATGAAGASGSGIARPGRGRGGGAVDVSVSNLSTTQRWETVKALRTVGFAAWLRTPDQGGKNGLASHAADNTPDAYKSLFTWWEKYAGTERRCAARRII